MWGETCRWAAMLSDPTLVYVVYIVVKISWVRRLTQYLEVAMGPPFTNVFASCCTSPKFVFGTTFATLRMALGPICHLMLVVICRLCCFIVLANRWQVILGEFPGTQCPCSAHTVRPQCNNLATHSPFMRVWQTFVLGNNTPC